MTGDVVLARRDGCDVAPERGGERRLLGGERRQRPTMRRAWHAGHVMQCAVAGSDENQNSNACCQPHPSRHRRTLRNVKPATWADALRRARLTLDLEPFVEIGADRLHQRLDLAVEEMVGARDHLLLDHDALLGLELVDQTVDVLVRHHGVLVAVDDHPGRRAGREEGEVVEVRRRGDRNKAFDLGPAHEQLHADPGSEGEAGNPAAPRLRVDGLRPVERRGGIGQFPLAVVERALAAPDPAEVEAQHGEVPVHEGVVELVDDLVVHRAPKLRVRVQQDADRGILLPGRVVAALDASGRAGEDDLRHEFRTSIEWLTAIGPPRTGAPVRARLTASASTRKYLEPFQILASGAAEAWRRVSRRALSNTGAGAKSKCFEGAWVRRLLSDTTPPPPHPKPKGPMTDRIYLDWNATAPLRPQARSAALAALEAVGNPSSVHAEGRAARRLIEQAREEVAALTGAEPRNVVFTSGGTEANMLALTPRSGADRLLISAVEHPSVLAGGRFPAAGGGRLPGRGLGQTRQDDAVGR